MFINHDDNTGKNSDGTNIFLLGGMMSVILIIGVLLIISYLPFDFFPLPNKTPTPTPTISILKSKVVETSNLQLQEMWRWSGIIASGHTPNLVITDDYLILAELDNNAHVRIITFNAHTGQKIWERPYSEIKASNSFDSLGADDTQVYVGSGRYVQAFDLNDGHLIWTGAKGSAGIPGPLNVYPQDDKLYGYSYYDYVLYILDSWTGETLESSTIPGILIRMAGIDYGEYIVDPKVKTTNLKI